MTRKITTALAVLLFAILTIAGSCPTPPTPPVPPTPIYITVDVCETSGILPNRLCRIWEHVVQRQFEKGKEPTTICTTHLRPTNTYGGSIVAGCYSFPVAVGDRMTFLDNLAKYGATETRVFFTTQWGADGDLQKQRFGQPFKFLFLWATQYGGPSDTPLFSLAQWNDPWWTARRDEFQRMKELGLRLHVVAEDGTSAKQGGRPKMLYPWYSNAEKWGNPPGADEGHVKFPGGLWEIEKTGNQYRELYIGFWKKIIAELQAVGLPFDFEIENEIANKGGVFGPNGGYATPGEADHVMQHYLEWARAVLKGGKDPMGQQHAAILPADARLIISGGVSREHSAGLADIFSVHGHSRPEDVLAAYGIPAGKVAVSMDGGFKGDGDAGDNPNSHEPSIVQFGQIANRMKTCGYKMIEWFSFRMEADPPHIANLDRFNWETLKAVSAAWGFIK